MEFGNPGTLGDRQGHNLTGQKLDNNLSPNEDPSPLELADLIDVQTLQSLMDDFHALVQVPMAIIDRKGRVLVGVGWQQICLNFHRVHPATCANCLESDLLLSSGVPMGEFKLYKCRNNMWDIATPILIDGRHVGNLFSGQFFFDDELPDYDLFRGQARQYGFDEEAYLAAVDQAPRLSRETVNRAMAFFVKLAHIISRLGYSNLQLSHSLTEREQLMGSLRESEQRWQTTLMSVGDGVIATDVRGKVTFLNPVAERLTGWTGAEAAGQPLETVFNIIHEQTGQPAQNPVAKVLQSGQVVELANHTALIARNGQVTPIEDSAAPIRDTTGQIMGVVMVFHDVMVQRQAEAELRKHSEALRKSEEKFARAFRSSPVALSISTVADGRFIEVNDSYLALFGFNRIELIGQTSIELGIFPNPDDRQEVVSRFRGGPGFRNYEIRLLTKSGEPREVLFSTEPIEVDGQDCMLSLVVDFTERKQAESELRKNSEALRESEERFRRAIMSAPYPLMIRREDGQVLMVNEAWTEITGYTLEDIPTISEWTKKAYPERAIQTQEFIFKEGFSQTAKKGWGEFAVTTSRGEKRIWDFSTAPLGRDHAGRDLVLSMASDVTERKQVEVALHASEQEQRELADTLEVERAKLARSNRDLEQFAFIASHDLQEPLRKICMFGDRLREQLSGDCPEEVQDHFNRMTNAAGRMQTMIDGLLELSRVTTRGGTFAPVLLTEIAREVLSDLEARVQATGGQVKIDDLPTIEADELQIRQLFQNLIGNALKFHKPDISPVIHISGGMTPIGNITLQIEDNGIGFDEQYTDQIFQPFQRLHGRSEYEGTGLGLSICQKIVERHHGQIEARSQPGAGTTFILHLPRKQPV